MTKRPTIQADTQADMTLEHVTLEEGAVRVGGAVATVPVIGEGQTIRSAIVEFARDPAFDVAKLEALIGLQNSVEDRQAVRAFNAAFVKMQGALPGIKRDGTLEYPIEKNNPDGPKRFISKFARWEDIHSAIQPTLNEFGFGLSFKIAPRVGDSGGLLISAVLRHEGGHIETGDPFPVPLDSSGGKNSAQAYGSTLSYGKKYAAYAALNLRTEGDDDDGVAAGGAPVSYEEAAQIKMLVDEAGIGEGAEGDDRRTVIVEWFNDMLGYALPKGYASIRQEDGVRVRRALLSLKAKRLTSKAEEVKI